MVRIKIDYGIDLGTTNSAIARMENGESVIKQTKNLMDTLPSCVYFSKNKKGERALRIGMKAKDSVYSDAIMALSKNEPSKECGYLEFKREMGSDKKYTNENMPKETYSPEELSAEVLKELKSLINDETINSVVITVPAMFTAIQKDATMRAAHIAGFQQCELLQEPIAACMAYGLSSEKKKGKWLVFDFGGGTFDAALVKAEDGILTVFDTEGDNYLGGKNLDEAVVNKILIPSLCHDYDLSSYETTEWKKKALTDALKGPAEEMRIALSFTDSADYSTYDRNLNLGQDDNGEEIDLEITITKDQLINAIGEQYQKAVNICKNLLERNGLTGKDLSSLILVGGPTYSPIIRDMLKEEVTPNVDTSINPMTAVARGAALYASIIDANINEEKIKEEATSEIVFLQVGYESTSVETSEWVSVSIDTKKTGKNCPKELSVEFQRADGAWRSDRTSVDTKGNVIEAFLLEGKPNTFKIKAYNQQGNAVEIFPSEFTIIQGIKVGAAPLPYNIGIAVYNDVKKRGVFLPAKGLEKNKPLPAVGIVPDRKITQALRPGVSTDILSIPVYQVSGLDAEGKTAALYTLISNVVVTGDDIEQFIPENSNVEITLHADSSEMMKMEVYFPSIDFTAKKVLDLSKRDSPEDVVAWVNKELSSAQRSIESLSSSGIFVEALYKELDVIKELVANGNDPMRTQSNLKELLRKIEDLDDSTEWQRLEAELREEFERLEKAQIDLGNEKTTQLVEQMRTQTDQVIRNKDVRMGRETLEQINSLFVHLTLVYQCMGLIRNCHERFGSICWKDASHARQLVNRGLEEINNHPTAEKLHPIACGLIDLMPDEDAISAGGLLR
ncbi:Hsp70 family protein [Bacteroides acidifaciens]|jgi:molecular chaperone DnaK|uniref:Hsp70 family protein n=1 Tax=Bacteroides acidifaciens TaxID=85831 RepID=UPI00158D43AE|nr:Hsp70 family protein [Bacteroides acidifaciens]MDE6820261.1 Hsp70 family protein [Bacteroides acidifaciens]MDE6986279.1 Hsp70 family protein [Bacteroides acidifaciens]